MVIQSTYQILYNVWATLWSPYLRFITVFISVLKANEEVLYPFLIEHLQVGEIVMKSGYVPRKPVPLTVPTVYQWSDWIRHQWGGLSVGGIDHLSLSVLDSNGWAWKSTWLSIIWPIICPCDRIVPDQLQVVREVALERITWVDYDWGIKVRLGSQGVTCANLTDELRADYNCLLSVMFPACGNLPTGVTDPAQYRNTT